MGCCGGTTVYPVTDGKGSKQNKPIFNPRRHCTDIFWLILFLAFWAGMGAIAYLAYQNGDPNALIKGTDSFGNICGEANSQRINSTNSGLDLTNRTKVFFFNPTNSDALVLCVPECPDENTTFAGSVYCEESAPYTALMMDTQFSGDADFNIDMNGCPTIGATNHVSILNRCVPIGLAVQVSSYFNNSQILSAVVDDLETSYEAIAYLILISFAIALVMILLMGWLSFILIWTSYILAFISSIGAIGYMWYTYYELKKEYDATPQSMRLASDLENIDFYYKGGIVVSVICGIVLLILLVMRSRLALLVAIFKEAGRAIRAMPTTLLMPFWTFILVMLTAAYFVGVYVFLYTVRDVTADNIGHAQYSQDRNLVYMQWYHIFGFLWAVQLWVAVQQFSIAGGVAKWYFREKGQRIGFPVFASFYNAFRYHLGSLAFGAMLIAIVQLVRLILAYVQRKLKGRSGAIVDALLKCCQCCLWLLEKVLKFINKNAYIEIAIYGYSFCKAAREAFTTLVRNALRVATINSVGAFVLFISRLVVASVAAFGALYWFRMNYDLRYPAVEVIIVGIGAWFVAGIFTAVYDLVIDAVFLCFAEDSQRNDGSLEKPLFASSNLIKFMDKSKRQLQKQTEKARQANSSNES